jgi:hypothetical protein
MLGHCLCESIQFEIHADTLGLYQCHCSQCRRQSGSVASAATIVPASRFRWLRGAEKISSFSHESGFRSDFCSVCGSPAPNPLKELPYVWVPAGLLEDSSQLEIVVHLCVDSKAVWDRASLGGVCYPHLPEQLDEFVLFLHRRNT